jgi:hypothetical protein
MNLREWTKSEAHYGRKVLSSGLAGARSGREAFLKGRDLSPILSDSVRTGLKSAALGVCIGILGSIPGRHKSTKKVVVSGLLGGIAGLVAGVIWQERGLAVSVARGAMLQIGQARDEHWMERNSVAYA